MKQKSPSELTEAIKYFYITWNQSIETQDDIETQSIMMGRFNRVISVLDDLRSKMLDKAIDKNDTEKTRANLKLLRENEIYQNIEEASKMITATQFQVQHVYELKNRRTAECFDLRAENAKLRMKYEKSNLD